jgi:hypothetical protein
MSWVVKMPELKSFSHDILVRNQPSAGSNPGLSGVQHQVSLKIVDAGFETVSCPGNSRLNITV